MKYFTAIITLFSLLAVSCGGGGTTLPAPNPNPQQQQPLPGQQQLPTVKAALVDTTTVVAVFNDQTMQFAMGSGVGAALPGASVIIEDPQNFVANSQADQDGAFEFNQGDVPPNFMTAPGTVIRIYQFDADTLRSDAATVTIQLVSIP